MKFKSIVIKNYKGIKELKIDFKQEKRIYTLIGLNESGKSTILEAISNVFTQIPKDQRHKLIPKDQKFSFTGFIQIISVVSIEPDDSKAIFDFVKTLGYKDVKLGGQIEIERRYQFDKSIPTDDWSYWNFKIDILKVSSRKHISLIHEKKDDWQKVVDFIKANLLPKVVFYPNFLFDFPEKIYLEPKDGETVEFVKYRDVIQDILYSIDSKLTIKDHILERMNNNSSSDTEIIDLLLSKMAENVSRIVFTAWEKLLPRGNKEIVIKHGSELNNQNKPIHYLQFKLKEGANQFFISERSLGFKWFFTFLLFTGLRKNRISDKGEVLFLLDEPASNLHPTAQKSLLSIMDEILSRSSLIYTTHSHYLINPDWLHGMYIVKNNAINYANEIDFGSKATDISILPYKQFVAQYPDQREYFQPLLDTLDYQPGLIEKVPSIILCEGKNDYYTFLYMIKVYFNEGYNLNFYPAGGANSDEQVIRLYMAWNKPFFIIRDSDGGGTNAIEKYKKLFPVNVTENNAFTLKDIDEDLDNIPLEDVFSDDEKLRIVNLLDAKLDVFDKGKFNLSIQFLLSEKKKIELSEITINRFKLIFDFLSETLKKQGVS